jgi:hypothetical protein
MSYLPAILQLLAVTPPRPGSVTIVDVRHDADCAFFRVGVCECSPDLSVAALRTSGPHCTRASSGAKPS